MFLIREFELACGENYARGFIRGFLHLYIGQEAVAVGVCQALRKGDLVLTTHRGHAHNIANAETPGYKRRYVIFEEILQRALEKTRIRLYKTNERHLDPVETPVRPKVMVDDSTSYRNDGNNVDIDREIVEMVKNGLRYQVLTRLMSSNIERYNIVLRGVR